jgi:DNA-binding MarR family transcriptional regulator
MEAYIYGGIFALANRLQMLGDKFDSNISTKQWFLIAIISKFTDESPTISMTAERMGTSRQNVKKMANILEKKGFLEVIKDKEDGRIQRLKLTEYCLGYFEERHKREEHYIGRLFKDFDEDMLLHLIKGIKQLEKNITEIENEGEK